MKIATWLVALLLTSAIFAVPVVALADEDDTLARLDEQYEFEQEYNLNDGEGDE